MRDKCLVIAEIGVNHNGVFDIANALASIAADCGADIIKYQGFVAKEEVADFSPLCEYQVGSGQLASQLDLIAPLELNVDQLGSLRNSCQSLDVGFSYSVFDMVSAGWLRQVPVDLVKIPSGEITNKALLREICNAVHGHDVLVSTGMAELSEVGNCLDF